MSQFVFSGTCRPGCARDRFHDGECSDQRDLDEIDYLREVAEAAENVVTQWRGDISRKPHIGRLRDALAAWKRTATAKPGDEK